MVTHEYPGFSTTPTDGSELGLIELGAIRSETWANTEEECAAFQLASANPTVG